jgi:hypothetical protein
LSADTSIHECSAEVFRLALEKGFNKEKKAADPWLHTMSSLVRFGFSSTEIPPSFEKFYRPEDFHRILVVSDKSLRICDNEPVSIADDRLEAFAVTRIKPGFLEPDITGGRRFDSFPAVSRNMPRNIGCISGRRSGMQSRKHD